MKKQNLIRSFQFIIGVAIAIIGLTEAVHTNALGTATEFYAWLFSWIVVISGMVLSGKVVFDFYDKSDEGCRK